MGKNIYAAHGSMLRVMIYTALSFGVFIISVLNGGEGYQLCINILTMGVVCFLLPIIFFLNRRSWAGRLTFSSKEVTLNCFLYAPIILPWDSVIEIGWIENSFRLVRSFQLYLSVLPQEAGKKRFFRTERIRTGFIRFDYREVIAVYLHANMPDELEKKLEDALSYAPKCLIVFESNEVRDRKSNSRPY